MIQTIQGPDKIRARKKHRCDYCLQPITPGEIYERTVLKYDDIYSWKSHLHCSTIAHKLKMFDNADEGVNDEYFGESIRSEYQSLMSKHHSDLYESKGFVYPKFPEQLFFVLQTHNIPQNV